MREIKFRAWDKENAIMIYDSDSEANFTAFDGQITVKYMIEQYYEGGGEILSRKIKEECDVEIMQFTGLTDKNGKEIYEGDIFHVAKNKKYTVKYLHGTSNFELYVGCFGLYHDEDLFFPFDEYAMGHGEVIGNIYETPQLINP